MDAEWIYESLENMTSGVDETQRQRIATHYGPPLTDQMVAAAEAHLGVKLPQAYIDLLKQINGGYTINTWIRFERVEQFHKVEELPGVGYSEGLDSECGSKYKQEEWEYPEGTLWITGDGHTGIFFDYRQCGPQGEPSVLWLDVEEEEEETIAENVAEFLAILEEQCQNPIRDEDEEEEDW
ncbi:MAG TPA: SMI1/KNR4 family protein [Fimbriimonadaceae bacterium]|nr:SMI1/KNR4 family protein [Fimbriimonadaceae bacterium]